MKIKKIMTKKQVKKIVKKLNRNELIEIIFIYSNYFETLKKFIKFG